MAVTPYVVGQWVRGEKFYGRGALIDEILTGNRNCLWLLGTRRIGKTSILKQLEYLTATLPELGYFPVYWDFQGAEAPEDLHEGFSEALLDACDRLEELGIDLDTVEGDDLFTSLSRLRRELRSRERTLLLLGDEVEELVTINETAPRFLRRLRRSLQSAEGIRTVLASKIRLWDLAYEETSTSPFLHGFTPPLFVYGLDDDAARALVCQSQLPETSRPQIDAGTVQEIRRRCNNHPYLLQLLGERLLELGELERAAEEIATDQMVAHFFAVDFEMLTEAERDIIRIIGKQHEVTSNAIQEQLDLQSASLRGCLQRLEHLGFIHRSPEGGYALANSFFKRWFDELPSVNRTPMTGASAHPTLRTRILDDGLAQASEQLVDGRYQLLESLGKGATGHVFKARDTLLEEVVAIKVLKEEHLVDSEVLERLRREVALSRELTHPNILKVFHLGDDDGLRYVTMQYVDGPDLARVLADGGALSVATAVDLATRLAGALQVAHHGKVLHRDIKPANILIDRDGEPRITDFGLARLVGGPGITRKGIFLGTPAYASPEQIQGQELDERSDLYSLGVVIFELVTGHRPFVGHFGNEVLMMHLEEEPPSPRRLRPEIPKQLEDLILRCLAKDREQRFQSAGELAASLAMIVL